MKLLEALVGTLSTTLAAETAARIAADNALQNALNAETAARMAADSTLQSSLNAETAARVAADGGLQSALSAETAARMAADSTLQSSLNAETAARVAADGALQGLPGYEFVQNTVFGPFGGSVVVQVECPPGKVPLSGGLFLSVDAKVVRSIPFATASGTSGWEIEARGDNPLILGAGSAVGVNALCVNGP